MDRSPQQSVEKKVNHIEQEARMVLPGIQALFGFQLVAVFNQNFKSSLTPFEQKVHLAALLLMAISAILVMAPAAYHRQAHHKESQHFVDVSSRFLAAAMVPLAIGSCLDIYLITQIIVGSSTASAMITGTLAAIYSWAWLIYPQLCARKTRAGDQS